MQSQSRPPYVTICEVNENAIQSRRHDGAPLYKYKSIDCNICSKSGHSNHCCIMVRRGACGACVGLLSLFDGVVNRGDTFVFLIPQSKSSQMITGIKFAEGRETDDVYRPSDLSVLETFLSEGNLYSLEQSEVGIATFFFLVRIHKDKPIFRFGKDHDVTSSHPGKDPKCYGSFVGALRVKTSSMHNSPQKTSSSSLRRYTFRTLLVVGEWTMTHIGVIIPSQALISTNNSFTPSRV